MLELENPFWTFSVAVYGSRGVADECLALQDRVDIDVNMLLFSAWAGTQGIMLCAADFDVLAEATSDWQASIVKPMRTVRRNLRPLAEKNANIAALRADVQRDELLAEKIEQGLLYAMADRLSGVREEPASAIRRNVSAMIAGHVAGTAGDSLHQGAVVVDCPRLVAAATQFT